jgi:hypothetical protein
VRRPFRLERCPFSLLQRSFAHVHPSLRIVRMPLPLRRAWFCRENTPFSFKRTPFAPERRLFTFVRDAFTHVRMSRFVARTPFVTT